MKELIRDSLPEIAGGLVVAAILAIVGLLSTQLGFWIAASIIVGTLAIGSVAWLLFVRQKNIARLRSDGGDRTLTVNVPSNSEIIYRFYLTREKVIAIVHPDYEPIFSSEFLSAFEELNGKKRGMGLQGYYLGQRFRPICPPKFSSQRVQLDLAPLNYGFVALAKDEDTAVEIKRRIPEYIANFPKPLPRNLVSNDPHFNTHSYNLLGVETCVITSDGFVHLRKRGHSVLTGRQKWDMAVSGHPRPQDLRNLKIDLAQTIQREAEQELGASVNGEPARIIFTGLHRNNATGDIDMLAFWIIEDTVERYCDQLASGHSERGAKVFRTTKTAQEAYVWDTHNLLVEFNGPVILQTLRKEGIALEDFLPEALACLELALMAQRRPRLGIEI